MKNIGRLLIALAPIALAGCGGDDFPTPSPGTYANLQFVNTSQDAPPIDVLIDGSPWVRHLDYGEGTGEQPIAPGSHTIVVQTETPGAPTTVIGPTTLDAAADMDYVVVVEGYLVSIQSPGVSLVTFPHQLAVVPAQSARIQVLDASPGMPVEVYLTAPGADLSSSTPLGTAPYQGSVGPTDVSAGEWEIRLTQPNGANQAIVFDSGPITLEGGTDLVLSLVGSYTGGQLPCPPVCIFLPANLSVVDAFGNTGWLGGPAYLRFVDLSPDAPSLSLITNANLPTASVEWTAPGYGWSSDYLNIGLTPGFNSLGVAPASSPSDIPASRTIEVGPNSYQTLYALGPLAQLTPFVTHDDLRPYSTQARLRFIQGSLSANLVDVYFTPTGSGIANSQPTYAGLPFTGDTRFVSYVPGIYDLTITETGSKTPIVGPIARCLNDSEVAEIVLQDAQGGGPPYGLFEPDDGLPTAQC